MVGAPAERAVEDTTSIMQLITHGIPTHYPDIKIINSHLGGALPMLLQRADDQSRWEAPGTPEPRAGCGTTPSGTGTSRPSGAVNYIHDPQIDTTAARSILDQNASACSASDRNAREPGFPRCGIRSTIAGQPPKGGAG